MDMIPGEYTHLDGDQWQWVSDRGERVVGTLDELEAIHELMKRGTDSPRARMKTSVKDSDSLANKSRTVLQRKGGVRRDGMRKKR